MVCAEAPDEIGIGAAAYGRDLGAGVFGELHGERADGPGGPVDQHLLPGGEVRPLEEMERRRTTEAERNGIVIADRVRERSNRSLLGHRDVFGVAAELDVAGADDSSPTWNRVTPVPMASIRPATSKPRMGCFGLVRPNRNRTATPMPHGTRNERRRASPELTVVAVDLISTSPAAGTGCRHLSDMHDLGRAVPFAQRCLHEPRTSGIGARYQALPSRCPGHALGGRRALAPFAVLCADEPRLGFGHQSRRPGGFGWHGFE